MKVGGIDDPVWSAPDATALAGEGRSKVRSICILMIVVLLGFAIVYPAGAAVLSRRDYGTFAFWKVPNRIGYCGRTYDDGGVVSGSPQLFESEVAGQQAKWAFLSWTFSGRSIDAVTTPGGGQHEVPCANALYIPLGAGRWEEYSLSGGP